MIDGLMTVMIIKILGYVDSWDPSVLTGESGKHLIKLVIILNLVVQGPSVMTPSRKYLIARLGFEAPSLNLFRLRPHTGAIATLRLKSVRVQSRLLKISFALPERRQRLFRAAFLAHLSASRFSNLLSWTGAVSAVSAVSALLNDVYFGD